MKKKKVSILVLLFAILLVLYFTLKNDYKNIIRSIVSVNKLYFIFGIILFLFALFLKSISLKIFLSEYKKDYKLSNSFKLTLIGQLLNGITPFSSGGHNCLLIGSPGSGKTMMARRIPTILPKLSFEESLEVTKIHSIAGNICDAIPIIVNRPFRSPHHTISKTSLVGGGRVPKPGEISLSHFGVLFLDELPEFDKSTIEVLRGPLEDGKITISRVNATLTYPCKFMLVASMNPCPCGYFGSDRECTCTTQAIQKYIGKISGPLLDRIDIQVEVSSVSYENLNNHNKEESSEEVRKRVQYARLIQLERYKKYKIFSNSELTPSLIEKYCKLDSECTSILEKAFDRLGFSARAYGRILKVARTIADMDKSEDIKSKHLLEAVQYRSLDKKYINH